MQGRNETNSRDSNAKLGVARFGPYEADFERNELRKSGVRIRLQDQPLKLLRILLENQDRIVSREELRQGLWPGDVFVNFNACLNTTLNKLRHALREDPDRPLFIETIPREGYRFMAPVTWTETPVSLSLPSRSTAGTLANNERYMFARLRAFSRDWLGGRRAGATALSLAAIAVTAMFFRGPAQQTPASARYKIVVLVMPFENLTTDHSQDFVSEGFTEEMITQLGNKYSRCLTVLPRSSAAQLRSSRAALDRMARELGFDYVLEGSIRRSGDHLRIAAQLFHEPDQTSIWADTYDAEIGDDMIALESEVSTRIAESLALEIVPYAHSISPGRLSRPVIPTTWLVSLLT